MSPSDAASVGNSGVYEHHADEMSRKHASASALDQKIQINSTNGSQRIVNPSSGKIKTSTRVCLSWDRWPEHICRPIRMLNLLF